jgi:hypothetical protein
MQVLVHTDHHVEDRERLVPRVEAEAVRTLAWVSGRVTRVDVHLSSEGSERSAVADMRCTVLARPAGHDPVSVTKDAETIDAAVTDALTTLKRLLEDETEREVDVHGRATIRGGRKG